MKNPEPKIRHIMAPTRRIDEIVSGIPFEEIYSTVLSKSFILPGMAEINIAEIDTLEKKSKKDLIFLLLFIITFVPNKIYCLAGYWIEEVSPGKFESIFYEKTKQKINEYKNTKKLSLIHI